MSDEGQPASGSGVQTPASNTSGSQNGGESSGSGDSSQTSSTGGTDYPALGGTQMRGGNPWKVRTTARNDSPRRKMK